LWALDDKSEAFFYTNNDDEFYHRNTAHISLYQYDVPDGRLVSFEELYTVVNTAGRFWIPEKVVSFWVQPNNSKLKKVLNDIEKNIPKNDKEWSIEAKVFKGKIVIGRLWWGDNPEQYESKFFTLEEYLSTPKYMKPSGTKKKKLKYQLPGESDIEAKRRLKYMYQENKK